MPEPIYTVEEVAALWKFSKNKIRGIFQDQPGIMKFGREGRRDGKRDYVSIRIPESVLLRVQKEITVR